MLAYLGTFAALASSLGDSDSSWWKPEDGCKETDLPKSRGLRPWLLTFQVVPA